MLIGRPPFETSEVKKTYERIKRNAFTFPVSFSFNNVHNQGLHPYFRAC